jgi:hypothetical protein
MVKASCISTLSLLCALLVSGCQTARAVPLSNATSGGEQWVWPYFLRGQATVLAFWNTDVMQCLRDVPALTTLDSRAGYVNLVTVVTGRDRREIDKWIREKKISYVVLTDLEGKVSRQLDVSVYPTYVYLDKEGKEVSRTSDIRYVRKWFEHPAWLARSGAIDSMEDFQRIQ